MPSYNALTELTNDFKYGEFFCNGVKPPDEYYPNILALAKELQKVRDKVGSAIVINSGWRTPAHNINVGGETDSQHLVGKAADVYCPKMPAKKFLVYMVRYGTGLNGFGEGANYNHGDIRAGALTVWIY